MKKNIIKLTSVAAVLFASVSVNAQCDMTNLDSWSNRLDNGSIAVTAGAATSGTTCGLEMTTAVATNGATKNWVEDSTPDEEQRYRAAFCINPNGMNLPEAGTSYRRVKLHIASCGNGAGDTCQGFDFLVLKLFNSGGGDYKVTGFMKNFDNLTESGRVDRYTFDIPDTGATRIEYDMQLGATGSFRLWTNATAESDTPVVNLPSINTDPAQMEGVNLIRLGSMDLNTNITTGQTYFIDEFESRRQTFIGGSCN